MMGTYKVWAVALSVAVSTVTLAGCETGANNQAANQANGAASIAQAHAQPKTVIDGMGHRVTVPANPQRIWAPTLEDPLITLGETKEIVGQYSSGNVVDDYLQKWLKGVPHIDFSGNGLDPESVLALNPDFIILFSTVLAENGKYAQYSKIAPTYVFNVKSGAQATWRQELLTLGKLLNKSAKAQAALKQYDKIVAAAKAKLKSTVGNHTVAIIEPSGKQLFLIGPGNFAGQEVYGDLGLTPPAIAKGWGEISFEELPQLKADDIFVVTGNDSSAELQALKNNPVWKDLPAVKAGHVYTVNYGHWVNNGVIANEDVISDVVRDLAK
ncbi:ABC transporter substrate-binding protein [Alicyclobacillus acidiphilus]|uniref:ABC transporter substrate-binding protein n=1 Tax=Alicyclobacillus acidiphilus TaxID=182455 RepID=UPI0008337B30|nr:ABC transporter substrate-binding protein [Alicyclobacillus acidiphilus]